MATTGSPIKVAVGSLRLARALGSRATAILGLATLPSRLAGCLDGALADLSDIARGVDAMHNEFVGMRTDILALDERVAQLRGEITGLRGDIVDPVSNVPPMLVAVKALDGRLDALGQQLESVDALAVRLGRFGRARAKVKPAGQSGNGDGAEIDVPVVIERQLP